MTRIVSGVQPTGDLHLGNYLGAIRKWHELSTQAECFLFLADLHAITVHQDPRKLREGVANMAILLMACGLDKTTVFRQSRVPYHTELQWLLMGTARMGWLNRMTQFKDKAKNATFEGTGASVGLFAYPVLQAADILLYDADLVPTGADQKQHLELCRDIAQKFNVDFGEEVFKLPQPISPTNGARIMSLQDPMKKMSKSESAASSRINLLDSPDLISKKFRAAVADSERHLPSEETGLADRVAVTNLVTLLATLREEEVSETLKRLGGKGNGHLKMELTDAAVDVLRPIQERYAQYTEARDHFEEVIEDNEMLALETARPKIRQVKQVMGLL